MQNQRLNPKQRMFLRLYLGRDQKYQFNATACHKRVYGSGDRVAQSSGSRLLQHPTIKAEIERYHQKVEEETLIDAQWVREQSVRLYDRAMGDELVEVDLVELDDDGQERITTVKRREVNLPVAKGALELIGKHTAVGAFEEKHKHEHVHRLERKLNDAQREHEQKVLAAQADDIDGVCEALPTHPDPAGQGQGQKRGSISEEVIETARPDPKTGSESGRGSGENIYA